MQGVLNATAVRKDFGGFIDQVVHERPAVVKRNRDHIAALSIEHLDQLLTPFMLTMEYEAEADGSVSGSLTEIDVVANASTPEDLRLKLAEELIEYAQDYWTNFSQWSHAPNRKPHLPYVLRILIQNDISDVVKLIHA